MRLSYDPRRNMAYIRFRERSADVETVRVSDEINVDLAPDGTVAGIELLNANEQLRASDDGQLIVTHEAGGPRDQGRPHGRLIPHGRVRDAARATPTRSPISAPYAAQNSAR